MRRDGSAESSSAPPSPPLIGDVDELLALHDGEIELDDPPMRDAHASATKVGGDGVELPANACEEIDGELFVGGPNLTDVNQRKLADCYLMTALAALAHTNPAAIGNMIGDNGDGTYTVRLAGSLGDVTVDDDFAVGSNGLTLYAGTGNAAAPELWVAVVEKAYAQANGGYAAIEGGSAYRMIVELTGRDDFTRAAPSAFSAPQLAAALEENRTVTASSFQRRGGREDRGRVRHLRLSCLRRHRRARGRRRMAGAAVQSVGRWRAARRRRHDGWSVLDEPGRFLRRVSPSAVDEHTAALNEPRVAVASSARPG